MPVHFDGKTRLTRREVATMLGRSLPRVLGYHGKRLTPVRGASNEWLYDPDEVERLAAVLRVSGRKPGPKPKDEGALAREVFRAFELGLRGPEIVINLSVTPERVAEWFAYWTNGCTEPPPPPPMTAEEKLMHEKLQLERARLDLDREKHLTNQHGRRTR